MKNKLRIIGGDWRSRQLSFVDAPGLRPTPARVRETVFNWLQYEVFGKQCLDLYAGSGALGFEAASRGAKSVVQVESNVQACRSLKDNALALSADDRIKVVQSDVLRYLEGEATAFDVVFLDPPFGLNLVIQTCRLLEDNGWLAKHAKIYVETERHFDFSGMPENWRQLKSKSAGEVGYHLFERIE
ncbi:16S rRNA (guanine(966)-N(2))-methyltransferase RsmD [Methylobacter sp.]|uniref:16S rRNA (guanine(966)-N(2))-methyltransferase RsmD n=1 Tax=Methylobacter sp. TaxID=2051955 RepID=UPI0024899FFD|nr:16S rRNA (guanine(966)-N(2))-methyltransferase RsmD [Methylobacter sp.]MDI1276488.1 16S rRNA (guanine(966)-N(2))-methyltransferase RsmD [Methylobacter sp.]MDI1358457.1 16S rRNA (guanine(966)-N(2))-methyltransferase RsmD [Methylobacter sp.]